MYRLRTFGHLPKQEKRHQTLPPVFDSDDIIFGLKVPIHQSEADELKYVKTVLENHNIPNAFDGLSTVLAKTKHKSVHLEISNFILRCLDNPLDITQCMKTDGNLPRSFSGDLDPLLSRMKPSHRLRRSSSLSYLDLEAGSGGNDDETDDQDGNSGDNPDLDDSDLFLIELLRALPKMIPNLTKEEQSKVLDKIPHIFISLAPDPSILNVKGIPRFEYYKAASQCAAEIVKLNDKKILNKADIIQLAKMIIMANFQCSSNIGNIVRMTKAKSSTFLMYLGCSLPFIAELFPLIDEGENGLIMLLHMYWISIMVQTCGDLSVFSKYSHEIQIITDNLPPLVSEVNEYSYETLNDYVTDVMSKLNVNLLPRKNEMYAEAFCKIATTVTLKNAMKLQLPDIILLLSIAVLEKQRASNGNIIPLFGYFQVDFYPEFQQCFDAVTYPIFMSFQTHILSLSNIGVVRAKVLPLMKHIFYRYYEGNPRINSFIDKIMPSLLQSPVLLMCDDQTASAYLQVYVRLEYEKSSRIDSFREIGKQLFAKAANQVPNAFDAVLHNILQNEFKEIYSPESNYLPVIIKLYPRESLLSFSHKLAMKERAKGMLGYLSHRQILHLEPHDDCLLLLAFHYINCSNKTAVSDLISNSSPGLLLMIWSHISMVPGYKSQPFIQALVNKFKDMVNNNKGIFSPINGETKSGKPEKSDKKHLLSNVMNLLKTPSNVVDGVDEKQLEDITYQSTVLKFFREQICVMAYAEDIMEILPSIFEKDIRDSPAVVTALIPLANFLCTAVLVPHNSEVLHFSIIIYLFRIVLIIVSLYSRPNFYKYLTEDDLENMNVLIDLFYDTSKKFTSNKNIQVVTNPKNKVIVKAEIFSIIEHFADSLSTDPFIFTKLSDIICFVLVNQYSLYTSYINATEKSPATAGLISRYIIRPRNYNLFNIIPFIWEIYPQSIPAICDALNVTDQVIPLLPYSSDTFAKQAFQIPTFIVKAYPKCVQKCRLMVRDEALLLLRPAVLQNPDLSDYVKKSLESFDIQTALLFIPQFVQSFRFSSSSALNDFLLSFCKKSDSFAHFLLWNITAEKCKQNIDPSFQKSLVDLESKIFSNMNTKEQQHYENELKFINDISAISARLLPLSFDDRKPALVDELKKMIFTKDLYIPSNPEYKILEIDALHSVPLKSHSRVPILVRFKAQRPKEQPTYIGCIFKIEDDVRMDALIIQLIDRIYHILLDSGINCFLLPYRIYATGDKRGVIECIQNAKSRHDIGINTKVPLLKYFIAAYGQVGSPEFEKARYNFIKSMAPYSLICYLFQVKDRHNANIMIDNEGHIIHIDFGFIFDISPGGNMKFEKAPFKLSNEMVELMGGLGSPGFNKFAEMFSQCFCAVRSRIDEIEAIAYLMKDAGLPCFKNDSFKKLRERMFLDKVGVDLQESIYSLVTSSAGAYTTVAYDAFQYAQNGIFYI
ncbi:hypothetical protein M9Y10_036235 [Tritrichomonas musculus]|uniref:Phosphatidylinositol 3-and 4-kinase family protein n=1 Tax=Tritrichomonas musculus TaxID=1915356 RepID=A0ABR2GUV0_9EUKA